MTNRSILRRSGIAALAVVIMTPGIASAHPNGNGNGNGGTLPRVPLAQFSNRLLPGSVPDDHGVALGGIGSDLFHQPGAPRDEFWAITDRGPNGTVVVNGEERTTFPTPGFDPTIVQVKVSRGKINILRALPIRARNGKPVTGLPNVPGREDPPYSTDGQTKLAFDPDGVDSEGLVRTWRGEFWVAEEYGPSLLHLDRRGRVIDRFVPKGWTGKGTSTPIKATLPAILNTRTYNRGFEGLTLAPDGRTLYVAVQSPLSNPDKKTYQKSRNGRIFAFDLWRQKITAEYVYRFEDVNTFDPASAGKQNDMKVSSLTALDSHRMLVEERTDKVARIYTVDLRRATNILGSTWDDVATNPSLEKSAEVPAGVNALPKTLTVDLSKVPGMPGKIEGVALADRHTLAVANDNDFGLGSFGPDGRLIDSGILSRILYVPLPR